MTLTYLMALAIILPLILIIINSLLYKKMNLSQTKLSPFECGFTPIISPRISFSLKFYIIGIIFLIFDIEIAIVIPMPLIINYNNMYLILLMTFFLIILLLGLFYEWQDNAINWTN